MAAMAFSAISCVSVPAAAIYAESTAYIGNSVIGVYEKIENSYDEIIGDYNDDIYNVDSFIVENSVFNTLTDTGERINII